MTPLMNTVVIRLIKYYSRYVKLQKGKHYKYYTSFYDFRQIQLVVCTV